MRKIFFTIFISLFFVASLIAQHKVGFKAYVATGCDEGSTKYKIAQASGVEGTEFEIPSVKLPPSYEEYQNYINVFAGAVIGMEEGCLNEDVELNIDLTAVQCGPDFENLKEAIMLTVKVIGSNTGEHKPFSYYYFNEGKRAYVKFKAENVIALLDELNMSIDGLIAWFISEGLTPDLTGIELQLTEEYLTVYLHHFSKIMLGATTGVTDVENNSVPTKYNLGQNYPNPFNPTTKISYSLPKAGFTKITIYNSIGVEVKTLVAEQKAAGNYTIDFNAENLPSGIYFYDLSSGNFRSTKKMILLK